MTDNYQVLIVEDDFHVAQLHTSYVEAAPGFSVLGTVGTGDAALRRAASLQPDLVLVDVYLPDWNGIDLVGKLDIDTMVLSAAGDAMSIRKAFRRGALAYLIKPFSAEVIAEKLRRYLRYRRLLDSAGGTVDQDVIERAIRQLSSVDTGAKSRLVTEGAVLAVLSETEGPQSAQDVAATIGISRATAQRYLSVLVEEGMIKVSLRYGAAGRPEHQYEVLT